MDGIELKPSGPYDAERPLSVQKAIFFDRYTTTVLPGRPRKWYNGQWWYQKPGTAMAATPGTSNHGKGLAVDFANLGGFGGVGYAWMKKNAGQFGWNNDTGSRINEPWHWEYVAAKDLRAKDARKWKIVKPSGKRKNKAALYKTPRVGKKNISRLRRVGRKVKVIVVWGGFALTKKGDWIKKGKIR